MVFNRRSDDGTIDIFLKLRNGELEFYKNVENMDEAHHEQEEFYKPVTMDELLDALANFK